VDRSIGMFAVAAFDKATGARTLGRERLDIKSLRRASGSTSRLVSITVPTRRDIPFHEEFGQGERVVLRAVCAKPSHNFFVEVGPAYFFANGVPERIREVLPEAYVVVSLRDPVRRAISYYLHLRKDGFTDLNIDRALEHFPNIAAHSLYAARLRRWFEIFGRSNVQVIFYEEVIWNTPRLLEEVLSGIGQGLQGQKVLLGLTPERSF
jgi:Sulfotransferase family